MKKIVCISLAIFVSIILLVVQVYAKDPEMKEQRCAQGKVVTGLDDKGNIICEPLPPTFIPDTMDSDGDGYDVPYGGGTDCNDFDYDINPAAAEICTDGIDNDCDELVDTADPDCPLEICDNGSDDDGDTYVDCNDTDCVGDPNCPDACIDNSDCAPGWCSIPVGACDGAGVCSFNTAPKCEEHVCGEDGIYYSCGRSQANMADVCAEHYGPCNTLP